MSDTEITRLMDEAEAHLRDDYATCHPASRGPYQVIAKLVGAVRRQQAQIAALAAARAPHGLPLEGTGPLPLERK